MTVEASGFIDDIDPTQPPGTDNFSEGDNHLRNFKKSVQDSFPNIAGAITSTHTELNNLDGYTGSTADLNILSGANDAGLTAAELQYVKGVTSDIQTQINTRLVKTSNLSDLSSVSTARSNLGLGPLATASNIGGDNLDNYAAGDYLIFAGSHTDTAVNASVRKINEVRVSRAGAIRVRYKVTGSDCYFTLRINGTAVDTARTPTDSGTLFSTDETVSVGDLIQLYSATGGPTNSHVGLITLWEATPIHEAVPLAYTGYA